ncbi:large-conductance mechanosensitive channel [Chytriomyces sp. MP71]|nr:large-conductance mechanosensitive channel [Chytriomyces sp. MP71]
MSTPEVPASEVSTVAGASTAQPQNKLKKMASNVGSNIAKGAFKTVSAGMSVGEAFTTFINRGSVVDLAVGVVMGAAFTAIVTSIVIDLITPIIGLIGSKNLANLFVVIHCASPRPANSTFVCVTGGGHPYPTIDVANKDGAVTWNYGNFFQTVINFILISLCMFGLVQLYSHTFLKKKPAPPKKKACEECAEECPLAAKKCRCCFAQFPILEEVVPVEEHSAVINILNKATAAVVQPFKK